MTALHLNNLKTQMLVRHEELVLLGCELKWRTCASNLILARSLRYSYSLNGAYWSGSSSIAANEQS